MFTRNSLLKISNNPVHRPTDSRIRITANPNFTIPDTNPQTAIVANGNNTQAEITGTFANPNYHQNTAAVISGVVHTNVEPIVAGVPVSTFDSSTYNKRERPRST